MKMLPWHQMISRTLAMALWSQAPPRRPTFCQTVYAPRSFGGTLAAPSPPWTSEMFLCISSLLTPKLPNAEAPLNCQRQVSRKETAFPGETQRPGLRKKAGPRLERMW